MRVGLVTPYSWMIPGGVNQHVEHLAHELERRGHEAWILAPAGVVAPSWRPPNGRRLSAAAERFVPLGTACAVRSNGSRAYVTLSPRVLLRVERALRRQRFDLVHVHEPFVPLVSAAAVVLASSPVVATFHAALDSAPLYHVLPATLRELAARIDVRIAVSDLAWAYPARLLPGDYRIIPNGVSMDEYTASAGRTRVPGRICFVGRAEPRKGLGVLVRAFTSVRRRHPQATLHVVGATHRQMMEQLHVGSGQTLDLAGVEVYGWVTDEEKAEQLAQAQIVCVPSLTSESFGIVLAEAMAAGAPVVASDLPGYRSVLRDGAAGRLVPPNDVPRLAACLDELLRDPEERERLATAGRVVARELSWPHVADQILAVYDEALRVGARSRAHGRPSGLIARLSWDLTRALAARDGRGFAV